MPVLYNTHSGVFILFNLIRSDIVYNIQHILLFIVLGQRTLPTLNFPKRKMRKLIS